MMVCDTAGGSRSGSGFARTRTRPSGIHQPKATSGQGSDANEAAIRWAERCPDPSPHAALMSAALVCTGRYRTIQKDNFIKIFQQTAKEQYFYKLSEQGKQGCSRSEAIVKVTLDVSIAVQ
jgi:hypothetical protein